MAEDRVFEVTERMCLDIIEGRNPERVKAWCVGPDYTFTAVDNSTGEAFTEDFTTGEDAIEWLTSDTPAEEIRARHRPKYVPFDLSKEEDRDALRGRWVRDSRWGHEWMVEGFFIDEATGAGYKAKLSRKKAGFNGEQLLERYVFLNGSPVGKPANGQQMASK